MTVRASTDYRIVEDRNTEYCRMIQNIDNILAIIKEEVAKKKEEDEARKAEGKNPEGKTVYLVVEHGEIRRLFFDLHGLPSRGVRLSLTRADQRQIRDGIAVLAAQCRAVLGAPVAARSFL